MTWQDAIDARREALVAADRSTLSEVRNILVHDYPLSPQAFAEQANLAARHIDLLLATVAHIARYLRSEGIML